VNEKLEGFFETCKAKGLAGEQAARTLAALLEFDIPFTK
jgi:hypothetical protein